ncbi:MAG TPA: hypothetical protein VFW00_04530 [Rhodocyclaceae bacterium]|nr:hypothetical protein [Rhodocyclaceae bacterium]
MMSYRVQSFCQMTCPAASVVSPLAVQSAPLSHAKRISIRPQAILDVVRRRGRSWGLLAQYEEGRLGLRR